MLISEQIKAFQSQKTGHFNFRVGCSEIRIKVSAIFILIILITTNLIILVEHLGSAIFSFCKHSYFIVIILNVSLLAKVLGYKDMTKNVL